jgi:hypothetical protein
MRRYAYSGYTLRGNARSPCGGVFESDLTGAALFDHLVRLFVGMPEALRPIGVRVYDRTDGLPVEVTFRSANPFHRAIFDGLAPSPA